MRKNRYIAVLCLALLLVGTAVPTQAAVFFTDVRVRLSIGKQKSISFTPVGEFSLKEDPGLTIGNDELQVSAVGGRVSMRVGGKTVTAAVNWEFLTIR